jgi:hypothetical protein
MVPASRTMREGIVVGLIAYASVAVFYSAFDLLAARGTLYTVDLLGKAVFRGLRDAPEAPRSMGSSHSFRRLMSTGRVRAVRARTLAG